MPERIQSKMDGAGTLHMPERTSSPSFFPGPPQSRNNTMKAPTTHYNTMATLFPPFYLCHEKQVSLFVPVLPHKENGSCRAANV